APLLERPGCVFVAVAVSRDVARQDQPDGVVLVGGFERGALIVVDNVIWWSRERAELGASRSGVGADADERRGTGHARGCRTGRGSRMDDRAAYAAFREGPRLLADNNAHAAVIPLERARSLEPSKGSVREALGRAYYGAGQFAAAEEEFLAALDIEPVNDYAHFGVGLCRLKVGARR